MGGQVLDRVRLPLGGDEDAQRQARRFVRFQAEQAGMSEALADDLVQATAELMVAAATRQPSGLVVAETSDELTVAVELAGGDVHVAEEASALLSALTPAWGLEQAPDAGAARLWCSQRRRQR